MILQLSLVYYAYAQKNRRVISNSVLGRLAAATHWLEEFTDPVSGSASNLGHNDGTFLLPFGASDYGDVRPTLQAASLAFLHHPAYPPGPWDALALVLGIPLPNSDQNPPLVSNFIHSTHRVGDEKCWGTLRAVTFHSRPAHADQLAVDLWWEGVNIALDAGSYLYNAPPPWDNALARTCVHNTVSIDGQDQMLRTGRFLWLKWTNAQYTPQTDENSRSAFMIWRTDPPIRHIRSLTFLPGKGFKVVDELIPIGIMKNRGGLISIGCSRIGASSSFQRVFSWIRMTAASISRSLLIYLPGRIPTYRSRWSVLEKRLPEQRMTLPGDGTRPPIAPKFLPCPWW